MLQEWKTVLEQTFGGIEEWQPISGGDTSGVFRFKAGGRLLVAKTHSGKGQAGILDAERAGLAALATTQTVAVPEVLLYQEASSGHELLVSEFIATGPTSPVSLQTFGRSLAELHQVPAESFGWTQDNYIGALAQSNLQHAEWPSFYATQRLLPQLQLAQNKGLLPAQHLPSENQLLSRCEDLLGRPKACPIHGDLWGGNYLIDEHGKAVVIDPSFYYGHGEVDLAMSRLFGGFGPDFYQGYHDVLPIEAGATERRDLYQLYYLLVHLNMFGRSYLSSVVDILKRYWQ